VDGIVFGPLRHAANYAFAPDWRPGTVALAIASVIALGWHRRLRATSRIDAADRWLVALRLIHYLALAVALAGLIEYRVLGTVFSYVVPWIWIWVAPLGSVTEPRPAGIARDFVACLVLLQFLQAYPVGGIQIAWGTFPVFALAALAAGETADWLKDAAPGPRALGRALGPVLLTIAAGKLVVVTLVAAQTYSRYHELGLPGTAGMRLKPRYAAVCETMSFNAALHADRLFSLPGMFSFNLWSNVPPPTLRNTTVWFTLLSEAEQNEIVRVLEQSPRACLLVERNVISLLQASGFPPKGPLVDYLLRQFRPAFSLGGLDFWVNQGRTIAPARTLWIHRRADGVVVYRACLAGADEAIVDLVLAEAEGRPVQSIASASNGTPVTVQPILADGSVRGAAYPAIWPLRFSGLAWIEVEVPAASAHPMEQGLLLLVGENGERLGAAAQVDVQPGP